MSIPIDKHRIVYVILLINGIGTLLPWNMFITANDYFLMKLTPINGTEDGSHDMHYKDNFLSFVGVASKLPNTAVQLANFLIHADQRSLKNRILCSIVLQAVMFAVTTALAVADSSHWISLFYGLTMGSIVVINVFNGIYQNCLYGQVAMLPSKYMNAVVTGMNISGVVSSLFMIVAIACTPDLQTTAVVYFTTAVIFLVISFATYVYMMKTEFFNHFLNASNDRHDVTDNESATNTAAILAPGSRPPYILIVRQIWVQLFNIFFSYFITLGLFPALFATITSTSSLAGKYFLVIWCFLSFNLFAMLGNIAADFYPKLISEHRLWLFVVSRIAFVPFFVFCNVKTSTRAAPVLFHNDAFYIIGVALFALSFGYLSSLIITLTPRCVADPKNASVAGMMSSFTLMVGIAAGISSSFLFANIV